MKQSTAADIAKIFIRSLVVASDDFLSDELSDANNRKVQKEIDKIINNLTSVSCTDSNEIVKFVEYKEKEIKNGKI